MRSSGKSSAGCCSSGGHSSDERLPNLACLLAPERLRVGRVHGSDRVAGSGGVVDGVRYSRAVAAAPAERDQEQDEEDSASIKA